MSAVQPELLLQAYAIGVFPMAKSRDDPRLFFVDPEKRGIIPLDDFHVSRSLRKRVRSRRFEVRCNADFKGVLEGCAESTEDRPETWINDEIFDLYLGLHRRGHCHSIETWRDGQLVGGLYGVALGGAFFGESMFSRETDASKVALVHLIARLKAGGFTLLDSQFVTDHLARFGALEVPRAEYHEELTKALRVDARFYCDDDWPAVSSLLQESTQTS